ncbi:metal ABC transporter permease [Campylobacter upsaliensis]|uniref:metal ABC transporter permease n=1 Tax=Campylobacter upsaliensis TaxID=28080 RepID=UPI0018199E18|nr:metal ABC transporter permease [Campylobacter upsaliensis]EAH9285238.1 metal ABC transporter permease [Campylobacter upsaliensis]EHN6894482.1 metal ABC transporter permease [Campylobacter upsaliensis]ELS3708810.1 metal ABC transporter permease [Campylobacter upsaliensis]MEB2792012.1 metal ABC transporter permease [Campylobacter upsaliensis]MEB2817336.1 metal ABC transporter permease [Campylobacter upsaliensis]
MLEFLNYTFFQNALLAALLVSIACGAMGVLVMINRLFSMAGGITHGAFGGIGLAIYFSLPILLSTSIFTLFLAFLVAFLSKHYSHRSDSFIAVIWAFGMAVGVILIDLSPGQNSDLMAYLFGSILAVSSDDLWLMAFVDGAFILLLFLFYRQFEILSFDKEFAKVKGIHTSFFHYLLIAMLAFCIVISIRLVGLILVMAMLSIPSFIAESFAKRLGAMMLISSCISGIFCVLGLFVSAAFNLSSGACIIGISCLFFMLHFAFRLIKRPK